MFNSGNKFALYATKKEYSNSRVVRKKNHKEYEQRLIRSESK